MKNERRIKNSKRKCLGNLNEREKILKSLSNKIWTSMKMILIEMRKMEKQDSICYIQKDKRIEELNS